MGQTLGLAFLAGLLIDLLYLGFIFEDGPDRAGHLKMTAQALKQYYSSDSDFGA